MCPNRQGYFFLFTGSRGQCINIVRVMEGTRYRGGCWVAVFPEDQMMALPQPWQKNGRFNDFSAESRVTTALTCLCSWNVGHYCDILSRCSYRRQIKCFVSSAGEYVFSRNAERQSPTRSDQTLAPEADILLFN